MNQAVFLDRDGVLSRGVLRAGKSYAPKKLADFRLMPYAADSVRKLQDAGFLVIVVTNQPDVGNGFVRPEIVNAMHEKLFHKTRINDIYVCPHRPDEGCRCRKPNPGMLLSAAEKHKINLNRSIMVGDRASDVEAAKRVGCQAIFIDRKYSEPPPVVQDATVKSLKAATLLILNKKGIENIW